MKYQSDVVAPPRCVYSYKLTNQGKEEGLTRNLIHLAKCVDRSCWTNQKEEEGLKRNDLHLTACSLFA